MVLHSVFYNIADWFYPTSFIKLNVLLTNIIKLKDMITEDFIDQLVIKLAVKRAPTAEVGDSGALVANNVANYATRIIIVRKALHNKFNMLNAYENGDVLNALYEVRKIVEATINNVCASVSA